MLKITIGIDASRNRSGGAIAHIVGILSAADPRMYGIDHVHLWANSELLDCIDSKQWLTKHKVESENQSIIRQLFWQRFTLPKLLNDAGCDVVFNSDAGSVCSYQASMTLSQDMLSFEPGEIRRYPFGKARLRLEVLKLVQALRLRQSTTAAFLTDYARKTIESQAGRNSLSIVIPHGIDERFRRQLPKQCSWSGEEDRPVRCLYVSNSAPYKHQWNVVAAVASLREQGYSVVLALVGGEHGGGKEKLRRAVASYDPDGHFIKLHPFVSIDEISKFHHESDIFVFASSCENLPVTLLEGMAAGLPICSSDRGPMPEVLGSDAEYFDPEDSDSIASAIRKMITSPNSATDMASRVHQRARKYTWSACAENTWTALRNCANRHKGVI